MLQVVVEAMSILIIFLFSSTVLIVKPTSIIDNFKFNGHISILAHQI